MSPSRFRPFLLLPPLGLRLPPINQKSETLYLMTDSKGRLWIHHQINIIQSYIKHTQLKPKNAVVGPHSPARWPGPMVLVRRCWPLPQMEEYVANKGMTAAKLLRSKENIIKTSPLVESYDPHVLCAVRPDHPIGSSRAVLQQPEPRLN